MEMSRDRECNEPQVVQGFPEVRQRHSRNHLEEEREPNKRKDGTFHRDVYEAPLQPNKHSTSCSFELVSPCQLDHPSGSRQAVGGSTSRARDKC